MPRRHPKRRIAGEYFAAVPVEILESTAYRALPDYGVRVLLALCSEYRGGNNGGLSLTSARAGKLGIGSAWKVRAGLRLLLTAGLVEMTRPGKYSHGRGLCALYALAWKDIDPTPAAFPPIENKRPAPHNWKDWCRPDDWRQFATSVRRAAKGSARFFDQTTREVQDGTTREVQGRPLNGSNSPQSGPPVRSKPWTSRGGHPLYLGLGGTGSARERAARDLMRSLPHLTDYEIARITRVDPMRVARIRDRLNDA